MKRRPHEVELVCPHCGHPLSEIDDNVRLVLTKTQWEIYVLLAKRPRSADAIEHALYLPGEGPRSDVVKVQISKMNQRLKSLGQRIRFVAGAYQIVRTQPESSPLREHSIEPSPLV